MTPSLPSTPDTDQPDETTSEDIQPRRYGNIVRFLLIFSLLLLFVPLYAVSTVIKASQNDLQAELDNLRTMMSATPPANPTREAVMSNLNLISEQNNTLKSVNTTLIALHIQWPSVMGVISAHDPDQMHITSIAQDNSRIVISGQADAELVVMAFANMLRASDFFEDVSVQSISSRLLPTPTPVPSPTPLPDQTPVTVLSLPPFPAEPEKVVDFIVMATVKPNQVGSAS
jgi:Tfp pilus assembly protein PilN